MSPAVSPRVVLVGPMGAGKTTVVSPLLCLILAQGDCLVVNCVPPSLLAMGAALRLPAPEPAPARAWAAATLL